ncbi:MAG: Thiol:disulfide interchange protein DsbD [Candidatus Celerinatantimonas neptuna]|nr:MAG: Thiol:disulfide interchange protein DsbD [Candidatus Celerinatantimonas neptuna]
MPRFGLLLVGIVLGCLSPLAQAVNTGWLVDPHHPNIQVRVSVLPPLSQTPSRLSGLLEMRLSHNWKTYWRSPGEAGAPPQLLFDQSANIKSIQWHWPLPKRYDSLGVETIGYDRDVAFPLTFELIHPHQRVILDASLALSACHNVCIQAHYPIYLSFIPDKLNLSGHALLRYQSAMKSVPKQSRKLFDIQKLQYFPQSKQLALTILSENAWHDPLVFVDRPGHELTVHLLSQTYQGPQLKALFKVVHPESFSSGNLMITIANGEQSEQQSHQITVSSHSGIVSFLWSFGFALIGGLILNVMPCVLPVLGIKLASILLHRDRERHIICRQFWASAVGIFISFWLLGGLILMLRATGQVFGWGIQFQSPWFIGFLILLSGIFCISLFGIWEIQLPSFLRSCLAISGQDHWVGHFAQGVFATLLATPCSAPFLVTAIGFAMTAGALSLMGVFTGLAMGMAFPWMLVATFPGVVKYLPRPGRWMVWLRDLFALMMLFTVIWLISLLDHYMPPIYIWAFTFIALIILLIFLAKRRTIRFSVGVLIMTIVAGGVAGGVNIYVVSHQMKSESTLNWQPFSQARLAKGLSEGKIVVVDITADWCITCQANKVSTFYRRSVINALNAPDILLLQGDWSESNPLISTYLKKFNRYGVPYNRIYSPFYPQGVELPVVLSPSLLLKQLHRVRGNESYQSFQ